MLAINRKSLSRRTMLRGAGACIALPFLEAMLPRSVSAQQTVQAAGPKPRMVFCYVPNGVNQADWMPKDTGPHWTMSPSLQALKDLRADLTVMSGLCHAKSRGGHSGADTWLTGADLEGTPGKDYQNSISADQIAAEAHGKQTRFPSLELSFNGGTGATGHSHTLAYDRVGTALPTECNPQRLFNRLFAPEDQAAREATLKRYAEQKSILDDILGDARSLSRDLGRSDQRKLDEYLGSVRETEQRLQRLRQWIDVPKPAISSSGLNLNAQPHPHDRSVWLDCMLDLCRHALQTDTTRVITFEWSREAGGHGENGIDHHGLSHHGGDPGMLAQVAEIDRFHLRKLARFLGQLKTADEGGGNMLDNTMVLFGSGISDGSSHNKENLPLLLAGGQMLGLRHGSHLKFAGDGTPFANVLLSMLNAMGIERKNFMDSTGTLTGLV
jgi:hypothetical protein